MLLDKRLAGSRTIDSIARHFWWPGIHCSVQVVVLHCNGFCKLLKLEQSMSVAYQPQTEKLSQDSCPNKPMYRLSSHLEHGKDNSNPWIEVILRAFVDPQQNECHVLLPLVKCSIDISLLLELHHSF